MNLLEISQTIRKVRQSQGMTVEQLARRSGFSKGFISQVENFRQTPSLRAMIRIAEALGLPLSTLFGEDNQRAPQYSFGSLDKGTEIFRDDGEKFGIRYFALALKQLGRKMDPVLIEYTPASPRDFLLHDSEEFFLLLEGSLDYYIYDNANCHAMHQGDTVYLKANIPHRVLLPAGCSYARGLVVYSDPDLGNA
jgi:transcriptional regulator with XRE-family HTH domain